MLNGIMRSLKGLKDGMWQDGSGQGDDGQGGRVKGYSS